MPRGIDDFTIVLPLRYSNGCHQTPLRIYSPEPHASSLPTSEILGPFKNIHTQKTATFRKLRRDTEFRPRKNVTGGSACYSFQTRFEFWRRTGQ
jgi:hypothetical protein